MILVACLLFGCSSKPAAPDASKTATADMGHTQIDAGLDATVAVSTSDMGQSNDAGRTADVDASVDADVSVEAGIDAGADATETALGRLCIRGPGTHARVGKGTARPDDERLEIRAQKVNSGVILKVGDQKVTVKGKQGGVIEGLALDQRHRVSVRYVSGGKGGGFSFRFEEGNEICAYYNGMYNNWRLRPVGRRACGPCSK